MEYPEELLTTDEIIVFDVHHHPLVLLKSAVPVVLYVALWLACIFLSGFFRHRWTLLVGLGILVLLAAFFISRFFAWSHANLVLTDRRLIYRSGVLSSHSIEVPLAKIIDVSHMQTVLERIFGLGTVSVESESGRMPYVRMPGPEKLKLQVLEQVHRAQAESLDGSGAVSEIARAVSRTQPTSHITPIPSERPPLYSEIVDQIERLDKMREREVISEEEFQRAKEGLLDRLSRETED